MESPLPCANRTISRKKDVTLFSRDQSGALQTPIAIGLPALDRSGSPMVCPQGDSNPCRRLERPVSWSTRRWGRTAGILAFLPQRVKSGSAVCGSRIAQSRHSLSPGRQANSRWPVTGSYRPVPSRAPASRNRVSTVWPSTMQERAAGRQIGQIAVPSNARPLAAVRNRASPASGTPHTRRTGHRPGRGASGQPRRAIAPVWRSPPAERAFPAPARPPFW